MDPSHRLATYLEQRADELGLDWTDLARLANITPQTLRVIRRGLNLPGRKTKRGLERALQWEPRSIDDIYADGEPTPVRTQADREARRSELHRQHREEREHLRELTERVQDDDVRTAIRMLEALTERDAG